jgi:hypothetical protein
MWDLNIIEHPVPVLCLRNCTSKAGKGEESLEHGFRVNIDQALSSFSSPGGLLPFLDTSPSSLIAGEREQVTVSK